MGRKAGKLKVEFIENQKARNLTYKRRKECLMKKIKEMCTLCDVNSCMFIYVPDHDAPTAPVSVWPPNEPALIGQLTHQFWAKNLKRDGDEEKKAAQFGVFLKKKARQIAVEMQKRAQLMDDAEQEQQDRFGEIIDFDNNSSTALMNDDDNKNAQFSVDLQKRAQQVRAQIDQLKRAQLMVDAEQQDQFGETIDLDNSSTEPMMPRGPFMMMMMMDEADCDNNGEQYAQLVQDRIDDHQQFGPIFDLDHSSLSQEDQSSSSFGNNYHHPQQQQHYELFEPGLYQGENSSDPDQMMMMMDETITADQNWCSSSVMAGFDDEQEQDDVASCSRDDVAAVQGFYDHHENSSTSTMMMPSDPDQMMMMMDETITADQSWCSSSVMAGFDDEQERDDVASCSRDDVAAVQGFYDHHDDYNFIAQLYTPPRPPMMTWQSTTDYDPLLFQDKAADYLHLDDLWV